VEYAEPTVTDIATEGLNGMELGDKKLIVQRASIGAKGAGFPNLPPEAMQDIPAPIIPVDLNKETLGRILLMLNMVVSDDLYDDKEYQEIIDDVRDECSSFGEVEDIRIPRPTKRDKSSMTSSSEAAKADEAAGVGRVYIRFAHPESASEALRQLAGRSFAGRVIVGTLITDDANVTPPLSLIFA
jgi:splicing factor U2AF subunit